MSTQKPLVLVGVRLQELSTTDVLIVGTAAAGDNSGAGASTAFAKSLFASAALGALLSALPTTLPATAGQAWLNSGMLSVS